MKILRGLYRGLESLYGVDSGVDPVRHLLPFRAGEGEGRERLLLREAGGALEVGLQIDAAALARLEGSGARQVLGDGVLADALPVIEGLSHLLYVAEAARRERPISGLELETQAEVDKFAVCVLDRWPRARERRAELVDRLFFRFSLARDLDAGLRERYATANRLALAFAGTLRTDIDAQRLARLRRRLRAFWSADMGAKRELSRS